MYDKASKCEIVQNAVEFLGQQISHDGITPTEVKLKATRDGATLQDVQDVCSFLRLRNQRKRFVKDFAAFVIPMTSLRKSKAI